MMLLHALRDALLAIWTKKTRSLLTMLGIIIGVSQIIALIGLGQGVKNSVSKEITDLGSNIVFLLPGKINTKGGFNPAASLGASTLTEGDYHALRQLPNITDGSVTSLLAGLDSAGRREYAGGLNVAVEPSYFTLVDKAPAIAGRVFNANDLKAKQRYVVIDNGARNALFPNVPPKNIVGQKIRFGRLEYEVIGVLESPPQGLSVGPGAELSNFVFYPYTTAKADIANTQIFRIILQASAKADVKTIAQSIKATMLQRHGSEDFTVLTQDDILKTVDAVLSIITKAIVGLASISLIVGGIGIMNIMLVSVTERTREIGLRKAIGATNWHILLQFLTESAIISLIGGAVGTALVAVASQIVKQKANLDIIVDLHSVMIAVLFSLGVGIVFGLAPAIRAARKDPIEALRYE